MEFQLNLSLKELRKRTSKKYFSQIKLLSSKSREYKQLSDDDKKVLSYLVEASSYFEIVNLKLKNHKNLEFLNFLNSEVQNGNGKAKLTLRLFDAQKSVFSPDALGNQIVLAKGIKNNIGKGFYPEDLTVSEFHGIINKMLDDGMLDEVKKMFEYLLFVDGFFNYCQFHKKLSEKTIRANQIDMTQYREFSN